MVSHHKVADEGDDEQTQVQVVLQMHEQLRDAVHSQLHHTAPPNHQLENADGSAQPQMQTILHVHTQLRDPSRNCSTTSRTPGLVTISYEAVQTPKLQGTNNTGDIGKKDLNRQGTSGPLKTAFRSSIVTQSQTTRDSRASPFESVCGSCRELQRNCRQLWNAAHVNPTSRRQRASWKQASAWHEKDIGPKCRICPAQSSIARSSGRSANRSTQKSFLHFKTASIQAIYNA